MHEVQESLLTLKSLFTFINRSSIRLAHCNDIQPLLKHAQVTLIQPSDTRWLSYSHAINAVIRFNNGMIRDMYPQLSLATEIFLCAPISTATVERDFSHEMNGNWYSWSIGSTPNDYVLAWRHTYNILLNKGIDATRFQWVWSVNRKDYGQYTAEEYWVGENYTHWLGINGFNGGSSANWSKWEWPNEILDNMMGRLHKLSSTKPMSLNAYATVGVRTGNTTDVQSKNEWLRQMCDYINNNNIKMASYNNVDGPNEDNMVFGGTHGDVIWNNFKAYSAYRNCLQSNDWIEPNITNPRLITDEQFAVIVFLQDQNNLSTDVFEAGMANTVRATETIKG
ncbi:unnamed protein product, partial [Rotaria sp. Silwood1]